MFATSSDGTQIHYEVTGDTETALVFIHGWMGNVRWWDAQRDAFATTHRVVALDLAGHGRSGSRPEGSAEAYANDIVAVVNVIDAPRFVLVAHSMSGAYAVAAAPTIDRLQRLIVVDTLKNLDAIPSLEQTAPLFAAYRADFANAVANVLPGYLFTPQTPPAIVERLTREFLTVSGDYACRLLEPLYRFDVRTAARHVRVPVRGIGTGADLSGIAVNRMYFADYAYVSIGDFGHYPMLEAPALFDAALRAQL